MQFVFQIVTAQNENDTRDGFSMIAYEHVREADVIWSKRIWKYIDLREKINYPLHYPLDQFDASGNWIFDSNQVSLWTIIRMNILKGKFTVFSPYNLADFNLTDGDQLKYPILPEPGLDYKTDSVFRSILFSFLGSLGPQAIVCVQSIYGGDSTVLKDGILEKVYPPRDTNWITSTDIVQYRLKEDWFFDKERSVLDVRILAIAPVVYVRDELGQIQGMKELFWLYFPQIRNVLSAYPVYNPLNDAQRMSFDDLFWKRRFSSIIYKESNVYDRKIDGYKIGFDALIEAEKINEKIRNFEQDIWNY